MPPLDTTNPRARSCSLSTPTVAPARTATFLSRMASRTTARLPIRVLCRITDRSTRAQLSTRTPGESTDSRTSPPETITPLLITLLNAGPVPVLVHELGRRLRGHVGQDRSPVVVEVEH